MTPDMDIPANPELDLSQVPRLEALEYTGVSERYRTLRLLVWGTVQFTILLLVLSPFWAAWVPGIQIDMDTSFWFVPVGLQLVLAGFWLLEEVLGFPRRGYAVRERDITYRSGWFSRSTVTVPYGQVQHLELTQGLLARAFGLKHLKLYTAGGSGNLRIAGLAEEDADVLRSVLDTRTGNA